MAIRVCPCPFIVVYFFSTQFSVSRANRNHSCGTKLSCFHFDFVISFLRIANVSCNYVSVFVFDGLLMLINFYYVCLRAEAYT